MDLAGTESLAVLALKAVQAVPHPVLGAGGMTVPHARVETTSVHGFVATTIVQSVHRGRAATTIVPHVRVAMMIALGSAAMMTVHQGRVVTMIDLLVHGETIPVPVVLELQRNSAQMKFATRVAVEA